MLSSLDLNLLPLQRQDGKDNPAFPGLYMATPPRRTARGRSNDLLVIYLSMTGNSPLEEGQYDQILARLAQEFYKTPGTVTAALKKLAESLNQFFLSRNISSSSSGQQSIALLTGAVLRNERLTLAQCGPTHAFVIQANKAQHLHDIQLSGRGLGVTRSVSIRFSQVDLQPNDLVVFTPQPPSGWNSATLQNIHGQGMESLRRRLLSQAGQNVDALVAHAQAGTGKLRMLRTRRPMQMVQSQAQPEGGKTPVLAPTPNLENARPAQITPDTMEPETDVLPTTIETEEIDGSNQNQVSTSLEDRKLTELPQAEPEPATEVDVDIDISLSGENRGSEPQEELPELLSSKVEQDPDFLSETFKAAPDLTLREDDFLFKQPEPMEASPPQQDAPAPISTEILAAEEKKISTDPQPVINKRSSVNIQRLSGSLTKAGSTIGLAFSQILRNILKVVAVLLKKILPDESMFTIPASTMAFTAVAVALVVAVAGAMVYFERGYEAQFNVFFEQAAKAAEEAALQTDPLELRTAWDTSLFFLNKAEEYRRTEGSTLLRSQAQSALDKLDSIYRLNFQNAFISGLGGPINITRLVATGNELFMLNENNGTVLRATLTGRGYELDPDFKCSVYHSFGPIVSISPGMTTESVKAAVILLDAHGNLMYCNPGEAAKKIASAPPHTNWNSPVSFTIDNGTLYVLDPGTNGVWFYRGMDVTNPPHLFFDSQVPNMKDVIDLAVNRDDLYLLHSNGSITTCKYNALQVSPTRCDDPATFSDSRPGRHDGPRVLDAQFQQILFTPPPDPSIYLLDPVNQSIYHFSLRLNFQRQFRSLRNDLSSDTATAFAISPNRTLFMATGNQVYYALLP